jgi:hypothetical protein
MKKRTNSKRKKKKRIGVSALIAFCLLCAPAATWADFHVFSFAPQSDRNSQPFAIVGGTVFRDPGFALPGAEVLLEPESGKGKKQKAISDARGEFAFRVPTVESSYRVSVKAKGYRGQSSVVKVSGEQRFEATFNLQPESK